MFFLIPLGTRLFETFLHFSSNGSTHLVYAYTSHPSAEHLLDTHIFVINQQKQLHSHPFSPSFLSIYYKSILSLSVSKTLTAWNEKLVKSAISPHIFQSPSIFLLAPKT